MELTHLSASAIAAKVKAKEVSARAVIEAFLARIEAKDDAVGAFLTVMTEQALAQADVVDAKIAAGIDPGPLAGVPIALKDNLCTLGIETTCASKILKGFVPPYDATVVQNLLYCINRCDLELAGPQRQGLA